MMTRRLLVLLAAGAAAAGSGSGCAHRRAAHAHGQTQSAADPTLLESLPPVERKPIRPTVEEQVPAPQPAAADSYRNLTARRCAELADRNSSAARVLEHEPPDGGKAPHRPRRKAGADSRATLLAYAADEARNRSIADALDLYFKLAGAEAGIDLHRAAARDLEALLKDARGAARIGLKDRTDPGELEDQLARERAEVARLTGAVGELNAGLKALLGLPAGSPDRLWPDDPLRVGGQPLDAGEAVRVGLEYRPDLILLRSLADSDDPKSTAFARRVLAGTNPLLAGPPVELPAGVRLLLRLISPCNGPWAGSGQDEATDRQIADLLAGREQQAEAEIRAAVARANAAADQARIFSAELARQQARLAQLEKEQSAGKAVTAEVEKARASLRKMEGERLKAAVECAAAGVALRKAQGVLVREVADPTLTAPATIGSDPRSAPRTGD